MKVENLIDMAYNAQKSVYNTYQNLEKTKNRIIVIETSLDIMEIFLQEVTYDKEDESAIAIRSLILRARRSLQAVTLLAMSGLEIPTIALLRDLIEIEVLLRYFVKAPEEIEIWLHSDRRTRLKKYGPGVLRKKLAGEDKEMEDVMQRDYIGHCEVAAHPTPTSVVMQTVVEQKDLLGPSDDQKLVWINMLEVTYHAEKFGRLVALLGLAMRPNLKALESKLQILDRIVQDVDNDKMVGALLLGLRLGKIPPKEFIESLERKVKEDSKE